MSKYSKLLGLVREVLPTGEKVLVKEGDDLLRQLHGLDERAIENSVSKIDAIHNAGNLKQELRKKLLSGDLSRDERKAIRKQLYDNIYPEQPIEDPTRKIGSKYFPPEYDKHVNVDEVRALSNQLSNAYNDAYAVDRERNMLRHKLQELNPDSDLYSTLGNSDLSDEISLDSPSWMRFKKIRDAMKASKE